MMPLHAVIHILDLIALGFLLTVAACVVWLGYRVFNAVMKDGGK
jgi:hypothetical protein